MNFAAIHFWWDNRSRWEKTALFVWSAILLFVSVRVFFWPEAKTVYPIFSASGRFWWTATDLYEPYRPAWVQTGYRYSPTFAILITPFALCPDALGGVLWRLFSAAALIGALAWLARSVLPRPLTRDQFALLTLFCLPLSLQSVNNGQANIIVVACMLACVAAVKEERWNVATGMMALAFICKVYPLALGMLLMLLYPRRLGWRMPLAVLASLLLPFLYQDPVYVQDQYAKWFALLRADDRSAIELDQAYRDLWLLVRLYGLPINPKEYMLLQILGGVGIAALSWYRQREGWPEKALLTSTLALATTWMMLLGPATESSSFVLLAPALAWSCVEAWQPGALNRRSFLLGASITLFLVAVTMGGFSKTVKIHSLGVHSWATLLYFVYLLTERRSPAEQAMPASSDLRTAA